MVSPLEFGQSGIQRCTLTSVIQLDLVLLAKVVRRWEGNHQGCFQSGSMHYKFPSNPSITSLMQTAKQQQNNI